MPRYSELLAQPGKEDLHGIFAGVAWELVEVNEEAGNLTLQLTTNIWKGILLNYYSNAAINRVIATEQFESLQRLIRANKKRYKSNDKITEFLKELDSLINSNPQLTPDKLSDYLVQLINISYPRQLDLVRKVSVEFPFGEEAPVVEDTVSMVNQSVDENSIVAGGYHTYWNTLLKEIIISPKSTGVAKLEAGYDETLKDVQVRILDQLERLDRVIVII